MSSSRTPRQPAGYQEQSYRSRAFLDPQADARRAASLTSSHRTTIFPDHRRATSLGQRPKSKWPPTPTVEDEAASLLREKSPPRAQRPEDDVAARGVVDQVPIMEDTDISRAFEEKQPGVQRSAAGSESTTPASAAANGERRYVLVPKPEAVGAEGTQHAPKEPVKQSEGDSIKRGRSSLRIDSNVTDQAYLRAASSGPTPSSTRGKDPSASFMTSPAPLSASNASYHHPDAYPSDRYGAQPHHSHRHRTHSSSASDFVKSPSLARPPSSASSIIDPLIASVRSMQQTIRKEYEAMSDTSSRGGRRGRDRKPRSRAHSFSSSGSEAEVAPENGQNPAKRSSTYSYTSAALPKEARESTRKSSGPQANEADARRPSGTQASGATLTPTNPTSAGWNSSHRQYLAGAYGQPSPRSPRTSPGHSPVTSPPASPGYGRNGSQSAPGQAGYPQQGSRPVTPTWLSPSYNASFDSHDSSHLQTPQAPQRTSHPTSQPSRPPAQPEQSQPQMLELNRGAGSLGGRSRPTSPLPPHNPGVASHSNPRTTAAALQPVISPTSAITTTAAPSTAPKPNGKSAVPPPPERPTTGTLGADISSNHSRQRRSFELPPRHADPSQAVIRSHSAAPHELPKLPPCPRPLYAKGYNDWSTLPGHPEFDICPTCRKGLQDAGIEAHFIPTLQQVPEVAIRCDMSIPWVRMAWLLLLQRRATHPTVIHEVTSVLTHQEPCPGRELATRKWYRVYDWENERYISNFDACPRCVRLVEALFPNLRGVFEPPSKHKDSTQNCDLRVDSRRFVRYVDLLDNISHQAHEYRREPNTARFVTLAKKLSSVRECREDDQLREQPWHFMPHLPDFTVCEECYRDVVLSQIKAGSDLASQFNRSPRLPPQTPMALSCQLYSPRMREVWAKACHRDNFELIRNAVLQRVAKERELQARHARIRQLPEEQRWKEGQALVWEWRRWA